MCTFLWAGSKMDKAATKVTWHNVCLPKCECGLGILNIVSINKALMAKHLRDLVKKKYLLWVKWCHMYIIKDKCLWTYNCN